MDGDKEKSCAQPPKISGIVYSEKLLIHKLYTPVDT